MVFGGAGEALPPLRHARPPLWLAPPRLFARRGSFRRAAIRIRLRLKCHCFSRLPILEWPWVQLQALDSPARSPLSGAPVKR